MNEIQIAQHVSEFMKMLDGENFYEFLNNWKITIVGNNAIFENSVNLFIEIPQDYNHGVLQNNFAACFNVPGYTVTVDNNIYQRKFLWARRTN